MPRWSAQHYFCTKTYLADVYCAHVVQARGVSSSSKLSRWWHAVAILPFFITEGFDGLITAMLSRKEHRNFMAPPWNEEFWENILLSPTLCKNRREEEQGKPWKKYLPQASVEIPPSRSVLKWTLCPLIFSQKSHFVTDSDGTLFALVSPQSLMGGGVGSRLSVDRYQKSQDGARDCAVKVPPLFNCLVAAAIRTCLTH